MGYLGSQKQKPDINQTQDLKLRAKQESGAKAISRSQYQKPYAEKQQVKDPQQKSKDKNRERNHLLKQNKCLWFNQERRGQERKWKSKLENRT